MGQFLFAEIIKNRGNKGVVEKLVNGSINVSVEKEGLDYIKKRKLVLIPVAGCLLILFLLSISSGEEEFFKTGGDRRISFLSGGVGQQEREILKEMGKDYPLKMVFSNKMGEFLADVVVKILDQDENTILITVSNGPWLFVDLPIGIYHLEASVGGDRKRISQVRVEERSQKVISVQW